MPTMSAFAYYDDYGYSSHSNSGLTIFFLIVLIVYIILSFIVLRRWWKMTDHVKALYKHVTQSNSNLPFLMAIGEKEQAQKAALSNLVSELLPIYEETNEYIVPKDKKMDYIIQSQLPLIQKMGLTVPDYVMSGEKFIAFMNQLTGQNVHSQSIASDSDPSKYQYMGR